MGPTIIFFGQALGDVATAVKGGDQFIAIPEFLVDGLDCGKRAKIPSVLRMPGVMIFVNAVGVYFGMDVIVVRNGCLPFAK